MTGKTSRYNGAGASARGCRDLEVADNPPDMSAPWRLVSGGIHKERNLQGLCAVDDCAEPPTTTLHVRGATDSGEVVDYSAKVCGGHFHLLSKIPQV